jgi:hypothetical protein
VCPNAIDCALYYLSEYNCLFGIDGPDSGGVVDNAFGPAEDSWGRMVWLRMGCLETFDS